MKTAEVLGQMLPNLLFQPSTLGGISTFLQVCLFTPAISALGREFAFPIGKLPFAAYRG